MAKDVADQIRKQKLVTKAKKKGDELNGHLIVDLSGLDQLATDIEPQLSATFATAGRDAYAAVGGPSSSDIVNLVNGRANAYAKERGAELVGKKWVDGKLVDNPNAQWNIDETTRDMLNRTITQAIDEGWGINKLADFIQDGPNSTDEMFAFSDYRARMIARTETIDAHNAGVLGGFKEAKDAGVNVQKEWWPDAEACEICLENADAGPIELDDVFPSGDDAPTAHPGCECTIVPVVLGE